MVGVVERLPCGRTAGIGLPADEPGLPRRHRRDARHLLDLALRRDRVGGLRRRGDEHQVDLVVDDQFLRDFRCAVRVGLAVLDHHLDIEGAAGRLDDAFDRLHEPLDDEIVRGGERGKWPALRLT